MTNLKTTTKTLTTLIALFIFTGNTAFAQVVEEGTFEPGINFTGNGITIKSNNNGVSNFLLINPAQEVLGGFQARKFQSGMIASGLLDLNKNFFVRNRGFATDISVNNDIKILVLNNGRVTIGNHDESKPMVQKIGGGIELPDGTYDPNSPEISGDKYKLIVETGILTEKVQVAGLKTSDWADYVFEEDYEMLPIDQLEDYVKENKHLPNVPSAEEVAENGLDLAKTDATLLEKIEESYLYIIELNKKFDALATENNNLKTELKALQTGQY